MHKNTIKIGTNILLYKNLSDWANFFIFLKSVSFKKTVEISSTQEICTEFTHIQYIIWVNSVQISWVLEISTAFLKETDFN